MMGMMVAMAACTSDDEMTASSGEGTDNLPLRVVITGGNVGAEGGNTTSTSTGTLLPAGAKMKLYEWAGSATFTEGSKTANGEYKMLSTGVLQEPATPMKWLAANTDHHFLAVSPSRDITNFSADEFALGSAPESILDLLVWRTGAPVQSRNANNEVNSIDVELHHLMAKLVVNFTLNDELQEQTIQYVKAKNVNYKALINYTKELADGTPDYLSMVAPDETVQRTDFPLTIVGNTKTYYQVMVPQEGVTTIEITMQTTSGDRTYLYTHKDAQGNVADIPLKSGQVTTLNLALGRTALTLGDITVKPWTTTVIADEVPDYDPGYRIATENGRTWYNVYSAEGLYAWKRAWAANPNPCLRLLNDITLPNYTEDGEKITITNGIPDKSNWVPKMMESGTIDGQGHTIYNMLQRDLDFSGFVEFTPSSVTIKHLHLREMVIVGNSSTGYAGGIAGHVSCRSCIEDCSVGGVLNGKFQKAGGLVGEISQWSQIVACWNEAEISGEIDYAGGLCGWVSGSSILGSYNVGNVYGYTGKRVGGLVGGADGEFSLDACYFHGTLTGNKGSYVGLVNDGTTTISNCTSDNQDCDAIYQDNGTCYVIESDPIASFFDSTGESTMNSMNSHLADKMSGKGYKYEYILNANSLSKDKMPWLLKMVTE